MSKNPFCIDVNNLTLDITRWSGQGIGRSLAGKIAKRMDRLDGRIDNQICWPGTGPDSGIYREVSKAFEESIKNGQDEICGYNANCDKYIDHIDISEYLIRRKGESTECVTSFSTECLKRFLDAFRSSPRDEGPALYAAKRSLQPTRMVKCEVYKNQVTGKEKLVCPDKLAKFNRSDGPSDVALASAIAFIVRTAKLSKPTPIKDFAVKSSKPTPIKDLSVKSSKPTPIKDFSVKSVLRLAAGGAAVTIGGIKLFFNSSQLLYSNEFRLFNHVWKRQTPFYVTIEDSSDPNNDDSPKYIIDERHSRLRPNDREQYLRLIQNGDPSAGTYLDDRLRVIENEKQDGDAVNSKIVTRVRRIAKDTMKTIEQSQKEEEYLSLLKRRYGYLIKAEEMLRNGDVIGARIMIEKCLIERRVKRNRIKLSRLQKDLKVDWANLTPERCFKVFNEIYETLEFELQRRKNEIDYITPAYAWVTPALNRLRESISMAEDQFRKKEFLGAYKTLGKVIGSARLINRKLQATDAQVLVRVSTALKKKLMRLINEASEDESYLEIEGLVKEVLNLIERDILSRKSAKLKKEIGLIPSLLRVGKKRRCARIIARAIRVSEDESANALIDKLEQLGKEVKYPGFFSRWTPR